VERTLRGKRRPWPEESRAGKSGPRPPGPRPCGLVANRRVTVRPAAGPPAPSPARACPMLPPGLRPLPPAHPPRARRGSQPRNRGLDWASGRTRAAGRGGRAWFIGGTPEGEPKRPRLRRPHGAGGLRARPAGKQLRARPRAPGPGGPLAPAGRPGPLRGFPRGQSARAGRPRASAVAGDPGGRGQTALMPVFRPRPLAGESAGAGPVTDQVG